MCIFRRFGIIAVLLVANSALLAADDTVVFSGPQVGEKLPSLKVAIVYGRDASKTVDVVELAAGRPSLIVFVNGANRPAANLTRCLMNYAEMHSDALFAGVIYLDSDQSAAELYLRQATSWWGVGPPVGISTDGAEGPGSYGLNRNVNLTVLVADKGRVTGNFPLIQPSTTDAPKILKEVVALIGGRIPTVAEVEYLGMPTQKPPNAPFQTATSDVKLRALICAALAANDASSADAAASALEQYILNDKSRQAVLGNTATLLLSGRGQVEVDGMPIIEHLRKWNKEYAPPARTRAK